MKTINLLQRKHTYARCVFCGVFTPYHDDDPYMPMHRWERKCILFLRKALEKIAK